MADVINWAGIGAGPVRVLTLGRDPGQAGDHANGGTFLSALQEKLGTVAPVAPGDFFVNGIACSPTGAIRALDIGAGALPAGVQWIRGLPVSATGQLIISNLKAIDHYVSGWPVAADGTVICGPIAPVSPPGAFTLNALTQERAQDVVLTWTASANATEYLLYRDSAGPVTVPAGTLTYTDKNVPVGTYNYSVVARNSTGDTASTPASQPITVVVLTPGSFALQLLTNDGDDVRISWGLSLGATSYEVKRDTTLIFTGGPDDFSFVDINAPSGPQTYLLRAFNSAGSTISSPASRTITVPTVPAAPTGVVGTPGNSFVSVAFTPGADGGSPILDYTVTESPIGISVTGSGSPLVVSPLENGTAHTFTVRARNAVGFSAASAPSAPVTPSTVPGPPLNPIVATAGDASASVAFNPPAQNGGSPITGYRVSSSPGNIQATGPASPIVVTGLTNDVTYNFFVVAINANGDSIQSQPSNPVTPAGTPVGTVSFHAPLINDINMVVGTGAVTFARSTPAYVTDFEGILRQAVNNEARFQGARRVRNAVGGPRASEGNVWVASGTTPPQTGVVAYGGKDNASYITFAAGTSGSADARANTYSATPAFSVQVPRGMQSVWSAYIAFSRPLTGAEQITISLDGGGSVGPFATYTAASQPGAAFARFTNVTPTVVPISNTTSGFYMNPSATLTADLTVYFWGLQCEFTSGQTNQAPGEYVPYGMPSVANSEIGGVQQAAYPAGADGVAYFTTENGNTVGAGGVVTEAPGAPIPDTTLLGFFSERAATNLVTQSNGFDTGSWNKDGGGVTIAAGTGIAPDGSVPWEMAAVAGNTTHRLYQFLAPGVDGRFSVYAKAGTASWLGVSMQSQATTTGAFFDLATGTVGTVAANYTAAIEDVGNGWYRCSISSLAANNYPQVEVHSADGQPSTWNAAGGESILIWGAQLEAGMYPTSYILTTTAAASRAVDALSYAPENIDTAVGSAYAKFSYTVGGNGRYLVAPNINYTAISFSGIGEFSLVSPAGPVRSGFLGPPRLLWKGATAWDAGAATASVSQGGNAAVGGAYSDFGPVTALILGGQGSVCFDGQFRDVKIYPNRLSNAELQALTAP